MIERNASHGFSTQSFGDMAPGKYWVYLSGRREFAAYIVGLDLKKNSQQQPPYSVENFGPAKPSYLLSNFLSVTLPKRTRLALLAQASQKEHDHHDYDDLFKLSSPFNGTSSFFSFVDVIEVHFITV
jgi:hypothetical protein